MGYNKYTNDDIELLDIWKQSSNSNYQSSSDNETMLSTTPAVDSLQLSGSSDTYTTSAGNVNVQPSPFSTSPKLRPIKEVLGDHPGSSVANIRNLALSLAREAIFGKEEMIKCSLSGRKNTTTVDEKKLDYIKTVVRSRVRNMTQNQFNCIWGLCKVPFQSHAKCCAIKQEGSCLLEYVQGLYCFILNL